MSAQDDDIIWRGIDRHIDQLDEAAVRRASQRPLTLPLGVPLSPMRTRAVFPIGLSVGIALVAVLAGGVLMVRPTDTVAPASGSPRLPTPSLQATPAPTPTLEIVTGPISQRMGWTCMWGLYAARLMPDLVEVDRAADGLGVTEGWVDVDLIRRPTRVWIGADVVAAARAHGARMLSTDARDDHRILVHRGGTDMVVDLDPLQTPAGRTAWFEGNREGPCPALDPADSLPFDPAIEPVSISKANAEQQRAIDLCIIFGFRDVAGMGKVPRARDAYKYVPLTGREPDLQNDRPVWIVAFQGMLRMPRRGDLALDPLCVLTEREPGPMFLLPWGTIDETTQLEHLDREYRLPPLLP